MLEVFLLERQADQQDFGSVNLGGVQERQIVQQRCRVALIKQPQMSMKRMRPHVDKHGQLLAVGPIAHRLQKGDVVAIPVEILAL